MIEERAMRAATQPEKKKARAGYMISAVAELYKLHPRAAPLRTRGI